MGQDSGYYIVCLTKKRIIVRRKPRYFIRCALVVLHMCWNFSVPGPILNQLVTTVAKWIIHTKYQGCMPNGFRQKYIVVFVTLAYEKCVYKGPS